MATKTLYGESLAKSGYESNVPAIPVQEAEVTPFVGYHELGAGKVVELTQAGVMQGESYIAVEGKFLKVYPLKFHLLGYRQFWTEIDERWNPLQVVTERPSRTEKVLKEHFEVALLVYTSEGLIPARASFRGVKAEAGSVAAREYIKASEGSWAGQSEEHKAAAAWPKPWARFTATVRTQKYIVKGGKAAGKICYLAKATTAPISAGESKLLQKFLEGGAESKAKYDDVMAAFEVKVGELMEKVK